MFGNETTGRCQMCEDIAVTERRCLECTNPDRCTVCRIGYTAVDGKCERMSASLRYEYLVRKQTTITKHVGVSLGSLNNEGVGNNKYTVTAWVKLVQPPTSQTHYRILSFLENGEVNSNDAAVGFNYKSDNSNYLFLSGNGNAEAGDASTSLYSVTTASTTSTPWRHISLVIDGEAGQATLWFYSVYKGILQGQSKTIPFTFQGFTKEDSTWLIGDLDGGFELTFADVRFYFEDALTRPQIEAIINEASMSNDVQNPATNIESLGGGAIKVVVSEKEYTGDSYDAVRIVTDEPLDAFSVSFWVNPRHISVHPQHPTIFRLSTINPSEDESIIRQGVETIGNSSNPNGSRAGLYFYKADENAPVSFVFKTLASDGEKDYNNVIVLTGDQFKNQVENEWYFITYAVNYAIRKVRVGVYSLNGDEVVSRTESLADFYPPITGDFYLYTGGDSYEYRSNFQGVVQDFRFYTGIALDKSQSNRIFSEFLDHLYLGKRISTTSDYGYTFKLPLNNNFPPIYRYAISTLINLPAVENNSPDGFNFRLFATEEEGDYEYQRVSFDDRCSKSFSSLTDDNNQIKLNGKGQCLNDPRWMGLLHAVDLSTTDLKTSALLYFKDTNTIYTQNGGQNYHPKNTLSSGVTFEISNYGATFLETRIWINVIPQQDSIISTFQTKAYYPVAQYSSCPDPKDYYLANLLNGQAMGSHTFTFSMWIRLDQPIESGSKGLLYSIVGGSGENIIGSAITDEDALIVANKVSVREIIELKSDVWYFFAQTFSYGKSIAIIYDPQNDQLTQSQTLESPLNKLVSNSDLNLCNAGTSGSSLVGTVHDSRFYYDQALTPEILINSVYKPFVSDFAQVQLAADVISTVQLSNVLNQYTRASTQFSFTFWAQLYQSAINSVTRRNNVILVSGSNSQGNFTVSLGQGNVITLNISTAAGVDIVQNSYWKGVINSLLTFSSHTLQTLHS